MSKRFSRASSPATICETWKDEPVEFFTCYVRQAGRKVDSPSRASYFTHDYSADWPLLWAMREMSWSRRSEPLPCSRSASWTSSSTEPRRKEIMAPRCNVFRNSCASCRRSALGMERPSTKISTFPSRNDPELQCRLRRPRNSPRVPATCGGCAAESYSDAQRILALGSRDANAGLRRGRKTRVIVNMIIYLTKVSRGLHNTVHGSQASLLLGFGRIRSPHLPSQILLD